MVDFPKTTLADVLAEGGTVKTGPFGTVLKAAEYAGAGVPIISVGEVDYGSLRLRKDTPHAPIEVTERLPEYVLRAGDIVFGRKGAVDRSAWVKSSEDGWFLGSDGIRLRLPSDVNTRFFAYQFQNPAVREWLLQHASGSTMLSLNQRILERVPLVVPEREVQDAIAEVLGTLDDKIAANTKLAETITEYVSTRFDSAVSTESTQINLADVCEFQNRKRVPLSAREREEREGSIPYYGASGIFGYVDEPIFNETLVLVGEDGSVIRDDGTPVTQYIWGPAWVNNHAHVLRGTSIPTDLLYFAIRRQQVAPLVTGAVQPKISMGNLKRLTLELPSATALEQLSGLAEVTMASYRCLSEENRTLAATRDALLPQLMSGKLRVKDIENTMGEMV